MTRQEEPFEKFRVLDLGREQDVTVLRDLLLPALGSGTAAWAVLDLALGSGGCETVIVEDDYVDREHRRAYASFYIHGFRHVDRMSTRLHFFSVPLSRRQLSTLEKNPRIRESYLGHCVLRPLRVAKIGRTVLRPRTGDPDRTFVLAESPFDVNVAGSRLAATGSAYMEQDGRVAACASCAIWMSSVNMAKYLETPNFTTAEITALGTRNVVGERALPSQGLTSEQMMQAFQSMGYEPVLAGALDSSHAMSFLYPYIESRIAPVLLLQTPEGPHAITAVGHTYSPEEASFGPAEVPWEPGETIRFWRSSAWVDSILIHDDQRGPYRRLRFVEPAQVASLLKNLEPYVGPVPIDALGVEEWHCPVVIDMSLPFRNADGGSGWPPYAVGNLYAMIVPLPPRVSLIGREAERKAARLLRLWYGSMLDQGLPDDTVLRTYLMRSNDFKRSMVSARGPARFVKRMYAGKPMPRWIWVTEVGDRVEMITPSKEQRRIRGEVVLDGNGNPWTLDFVALHLVNDDGLGYLATMRPDDDDAQEALMRGRLVERDFPQRGVVR